MRDIIICVIRDTRQEVGLACFSENVICSR